MTREIPLTQGFVALVDDEDYGWLSAMKWRAVGRATSRYAATGDGVLMHNMIMPLSDGREVDHRNRDGLNNQRANLRPATRQENVFNRSYSRTRPGYRGVYPRRSRWRAVIMFDRRQTLIGTYDTEVAAACAYDRAAVIVQGEFANLNFSRDRDWIFPFAPPAIPEAIRRRVNDDAIDWMRGRV